MNVDRKKMVISEKMEGIQNFITYKIDIFLSINLEITVTGGMKTQKQISRLSTMQIRKKRNRKKP